MRHNLPPEVDRTTAPTHKALAPRLRPYLELFRLPNLFTALADVMMGFLVTHVALVPTGPFVALLIASGLLYTSGMVLNDVYDVDLDARQRPHRPLPSGRIDPTLAKALGYELLLAGVAAGWLAAWMIASPAPGIVAGCLAVAVVLYDRWLKRTVWGPLGMGACRALNVLLGMSAAFVLWHAVHVTIAAGIGLYIVGVTWFARTEAQKSSRFALSAATFTMMLGIAMLAWMPWWADARLAAVSRPVFADRQRWPLFAAALAGLIAYRCLRAIVSPTPAMVQRAVKQAILSLIVLDAAVCFAFRGLGWSVLILLLLLPTLFLGRWIYST